MVSHALLLDHLPVVGTFKPPFSLEIPCLHYGCSLKVVSAHNCAGAVLPRNPEMLVVVEMLVAVADEQFEVAGEELQRHFSMDKGVTPERLRAAPAGQHNQPQPLDELFGGNDRLSTGNTLRCCMRPY